MKLSTRSRYGVRLMIELALHYRQGALQLTNVAERESISLKYLGQIVIQLKNNNLIKSVRGAQGGYLLARAPEKITLREIVEALEGDLNIVDCVETNDCSYKENCVTNEIWKQLSDLIKKTLEKITLAELAKKKNNNFALNYVI